MSKRYIVKLTDEERAELRALVRKGKVAARKLARANILLIADDGAVDTAIAKALHVHVATIERTRRRFVDGGVDWALEERPRPGAKRKLDIRQEAHLIALACSQPPEGRARWTLRLLADKLVELEIVEDVSHETVRQALKRGTSSPG